VLLKVVEMTGILTLLGAMAVAGCGGSSESPARSCTPLAEGQKLTWDGTTSEGHHLVIFESVQNLASYRIFYGTDPQLIERKVLPAASDSRLRVSFELDGVEMLAEIATGISASRESYLETESPEQFKVVATLAPVEGSNDFNASRPVNVDAGSTPPPPRKSDAELLTGLTFQCF
jgi:hypothetical protein